MAQSQIRIPSIEELKAAAQNRQSTFDPAAMTKGYAQGMTLQDTIAAKALERQKAEEELKSEIMAATSTAAQKKREQEFGENPSIDLAQKAYPAKAAESMFDAEKQKATGESEDIRQRNYIRQLYQDPSGKSYAVLGKVDEKGNPVVVPIGQGIENQPFIKPTMPAEQVEKTGGYESLGLMTQRVRKAVTDPTTGNLSEKAKGFLGAMDAPATKLKAYTPWADADAANALQLVQDIKNQIIYLRSGKQINEEEYKRLMGSMPSETRDQSIFLSNLANFEKTFEDIKRERAEAFQTAGYRNVQFPGTSQPSGNPGNIDALAQALGLKKKVQ